MTLAKFLDFSTFWVRILLKLSSMLGLSNEWHKKLTSIRTSAWDLGTIFSKVTLCIRRHERNWETSNIFNKLLTYERIAVVWKIDMNTDITWLAAFTSPREFFKLFSVTVVELFATTTSCSLPQFQLIYSPFRPVGEGGGGDGICPHGLRSLITFLLCKLKPPNLVTFPKICLETIW